MKNPNSPMYNMYIDLCLNVIGNCWPARVHSVIDHLGLNYIRTNFDESVNYFPLVQRRIRDHYLQEWDESINNMPKLDSYSKFKTDYAFEDYLINVKNDDLRKHYTRFRLSSHNLEIEVGRYSGVARGNRLCRVCNQNLVESQYHFFLCCPTYRSLRIKYLGNVTWPNIQKFYSFMSTKNRRKQYQISKYIKEANDLRKFTLDNFVVL